MKPSFPALGLCRRVRRRMGCLLVSFLETVVGELRDSSFYHYHQRERFVFVSGKKSCRTHTVRNKVREFRIDNYHCVDWNAHFPPNGRHHYVLDNTSLGMSPIADWRIGSGPGGMDFAMPFTNQAFARYRTLTPGGMGSWLVYWRQNMPGLNNRQRDESGKPMKNWWPFLFY